MPNPVWAGESPTSIGFRTWPILWKTSILVRPGIAILSPTDTLITQTDSRLSVLTTSCTGPVRILPCVPIHSSYLTTLPSRTMGKGSALVTMKVWVLSIGLNGNHRVDLSQPNAWRMRPMMFETSLTYWQDISMCMQIFSNSDNFWFFSWSWSLKIQLFQSIIEPLSITLLTLPS